MADLIDRQAANDFIDAGRLINPNEPRWSDNEVVNFLKSRPSVQPESKKGRWVNVNEGKWNTIEVLKCTACGEMDNRMYRTDGYCPNCGARMKGEADGD